MTINQYAEVARQRTELFNTYRQLSSTSQQVLQLMAVAYEPIPKWQLLDILHNLHQVDSRYPKLTDKTLKPIFSGLTAQGLLIPTHNIGYRCHTLLVEILTREAVHLGNFEPMVQAIEQKMPVTYLGKSDKIIFRGFEQFMRICRWAVYRRQLDRIPKLLEMFATYSYSHIPISLEEVISEIFNNPFDEDWVTTFPQPLWEAVLELTLRESVWTLAPTQVQLACLEELCLEPDGECSDRLLLCAVEQFLLRNRLADATACWQRISAANQNRNGQYLAWISFLQGDIDRAIALYETAFQALKQASRKRKLFFDDLSGVFWILALIHRGTAVDLKLAESYASVWATHKSPHDLNGIYVRLVMLLKFLQGDLAQKTALAHTIYGPIPGLEALLAALCQYWIDPKQVSVSLTALLKQVYELAGFAEYTWLEMEVAALLDRLQPKGSYRDRVEQLQAQSGMISLLSIIKQSEPWELCLTALTNLSPQAAIAPGNRAAAENRLAWFIKLTGSRCQITPKEQKITTKGIWSKGRNIALKRLARSLNEFDYLIPQDRQACQHIEAEYHYSYYGGDASYQVKESALLELVGHPAVFWEDAPDVPIEVVQAEPELLVKKDKKGDRLILQLSPTLTDPEQTIAFYQETPTRLRVIKIQANHRQIAQILGQRNQLEVPVSAQERVLAAISAISGLVTVHSDIGGGMENVSAVPADPQPHVHLLPANDGLKVAILVKPFAIGGAYFQPGKGGETVVAEIDGQRLQTTRNLKEERKLAKTVKQDCRILSEWLPEDGEWLIDAPEACLELLLELQELGDTVTIAWPEGEKMRIKHHLDAGQFSLNIKRQRDWFEASGELAIGNDAVLNMQELMSLLDQAQGRFIPLGNGEFLALTAAFRKQLDELRGFSEKHGKGIRFHPLAALALEDTLNEVGQLKVDKQWQAHTQKLKAAKDYHPQLPAELKAELRDYQFAGFQWLAQLAHWGVGACLADDMGLGKTLQALALILARAGDGATLVVAPLSVCMNWLSEVEKFTPTLNVLQLGSGDRQVVIDQLGARDLLVCSYGLLQQEDVAKMLAAVQWQTVVLDEAQAIKNSHTKRSQAAMKLQAGFKLITTGTPIENHLGELWNLFRFINPGLLGSLESFNQKFAGPIEREQDDAARDRLKKLIQPFILRRTKNEVLSELPSRTEILLQVELSKEEAAFYEALRQESIRKLTESDAGAGAKHLQVLAEIMKLRRACCNPTLVQPKLKIKSSKLELFGETLEELLDNGHKALVFSQFVDHLTILKEYLEKQKITYQYLDGQTPAKERKKRVDAFQAGEGDVFLISLKAGGTGLNLTAADYVIHMDPWWNPAVEDQASDRAHRIGQQRPVTIYRLVAQGTIEDKIVDLHHQKRDLANSLLEGADMSGKVSTDDLLRLIQEG